MRKAAQSVYFIGMRVRLDDFVKGCMNYVDSRPMKPALSWVPTEGGQYPFEVITMDFAEFTKAGETFIILTDKYSVALHIGGVKKGGTEQETISAVVNFARSNVDNIKKLFQTGGHSSQEGCSRIGSRSTGSNTRHLQHTAQATIRRRSQL